MKSGSMIPYERMNMAIKPNIKQILPHAQNRNPGTFTITNDKTYNAAA
jgi:hypothetical protein